MAQLLRLFAKGVTLTEVQPTKWAIVPGLVMRDLRFIAKPISTLLNELLIFDIFFLVK